MKLLFSGAMSTFCLAVLFGQAPAFSQPLQKVQLNCAGLGRISVREATPNNEIRQPLSDFLVMTLPSGDEMNMVSAMGANVWNWKSPSEGITLSIAPTWTKDIVEFDRDYIDYKKGYYRCTSKWL